MVSIENFKELTKQCSLWLQTADIYWDSTSICDKEFAKYWNMIPLSMIPILNVESGFKNITGETTSCDIVGVVLQDIEMICRDNSLTLPQFYNNLKVLR